MNALKLQIPEEGEFVTFKNYEKKKSPFMIYEEFESILVPEDKRIT